MSPIDQAVHYRRQAEALRRIAGEWADTGTRETLRRIAKDYEHMAERVEKQPPEPSG